MQKKGAFSLMKPALQSTKAKVQMSVFVAKKNESPGEDSNGSEEVTF